MEPDLRRKLEQMIGQLEEKGPILIASTAGNAIGVQVNLEISRNEAVRLVAGGWLKVHSANSHKPTPTNGNFSITAPGPAWWNEKQKEHAQQLADASERLNKTIQRLTQWGVGIAFAALIWAVASFGIEQGWW